MVIRRQRASDIVQEGFRSGRRYSRGTSQAPRNTTELGSAPARTPGRKPRHAWSHSSTLLTLHLEHRTWNVLKYPLYPDLGIPTYPGVSAVSGLCPFFNVGVSRIVE